MTVYQRLQSIAYTLTLFTIVSTACTKPPDNANIPVTGDISTIVNLSADPPGPLEHYNPDIKPKFIAEVVPNPTGGEVTGGVVTFTLDDKTVCGDGIPLEKDWHAICTPDNVGGGDHTIKAQYSGSKGYAASPIAQMNYKIDQYPIKKGHISVHTDKSQYTLGDTINIVATFTKDAETDPDFDPTHIKFSIINIKINLFGLFKTQETPHQITCDPNSPAPVKNGLNTIFTCTYKIMPDDFIEGDGIQNDTDNYHLTFNAQYTEDNHYTNSDIIPSDEKQIEKITLNIQTLENINPATPQPPNFCPSQRNFYTAGATVCFKSSEILSMQSISFKTPPTLFFFKIENRNTIRPLDKNICTRQMALSDNNIFLCQYKIPGDAPTTETRYFGIQYPGDKAYKSNQLTTLNAKEVTQITAGKQLNIFTLNSPNPNNVTIDGNISLSGEIKPQYSSDQLDPASIEITLSEDNNNWQKPTGQLHSCTISNAAYQCSYTIGADDIAYKYIRMTYASADYSPQYTPAQAITINKFTLKGILSITAPTTSPYIINHTISFKFAPTNLIANVPINGTLTLTKIHKDKSTVINDSISCNNDFICNYKVDISDIGKTTVFTVNLDNDTHYTLSSITKEILSTDLQKSIPTLTLTLDDNQVGYPYTITATVTFTSDAENNNTPIPGTLKISTDQSFPTGAAGTKFCSNPQSERICILNYTISPQDFNNNTITVYAEYASAGDLDPFGNSTRKNVPKNTIQQCSATFKNFQYNKFCDSTNGCNISSEPAITCNQKSATFTGLDPSILKLIVNNFSYTDNPAAIHLPTPNESYKPYDNSSPSITLDNSLLNLKKFFPISDSFSLNSDLFVNNVKIANFAQLIFNITLNQAPNTSVCGQGGNTIQRMFDCYARTYYYGGIGDDSGNIKFPDKTKPDPTTWYLVSCPDTLKNHCAWLSPEIPKAIVDKLQPMYASRMPNFPAQPDGRPTAYNPNNLDNKTKKLAQTDRLLWSGELPLLPPQNQNLLGFTDVNGLGPIPRCGFQKNPPTPPITDADDPNKRTYVPCPGNSNGDWNYYTNLGGYDNYRCFGTCKYENTDGDRSAGISVATPYNLSSTPGCLQDGGTKEDGNCSITMFDYVDNDWLQTRMRLLSYKNGSDGKDFPLENVTDAYRDICTRKQNDFVDTSKLKLSKENVLIYDDVLLKTNWHIPSYPEMLLLTGAGDGCSKGGYFYVNFFHAYCINTQGEDIISFRAANQYVPNFAYGNSFFSSSTIQTIFNGKPDGYKGNARIWIFEGGDVVPGYPTTEIVYTPLGQPNDPQHNKTRVQRCVSTDW